MQTARLSQRTPFLGRVDVVPHAGASRLSAWGQDVSETGMFIQITDAFAVGDAVSVRFEVDGLEVHVRAATIVWIRRFEPVSVDGKPPGIGIRFVSIDPPARAALRRLTSRAAANDTMVRADLDSDLPKPTLTLPPLSSSIIAAAGGRDLDDTQDLLPPASLPRSMGEAISLPPMTFTAVPRAATSVPTLVPSSSMSSTEPVTSLSPTEANLSPESRVFAGVPPTPRAVSMLPRLRTTPPTGSRSMLPTLAVTHAPTPALTDPPMAQPSTSPPTQKLHSLPPVEVDVFAGWTFARVETQPRVAANENVDMPVDDAATLPPMASDAASMLFDGDDDADRSPIVEETAHEDTPTMPPIDAAVALALQERLRTEHAAFDAAEAADTLIPSIVEERLVEDASLPPSTTDAFFAADGATSTPPKKSLDDSWANSLGPISAVPHDALDVSATEQFRIRRPDVEERPSRQPRRATPSSSSSSSSKRRPLQLAAVVLAAGCAAGAAVGVMHRASQRPAKAPVAVAAVEARVEERLERVLPVAEAEAELFGRASKPAAPVVAEVVPAAVEVPAAVAVASAPVEPVAPVEAAKVEAPVAAPVEVAKAEVPVETQVEAAKPEEKVAKAEKPMKQQKALVATPGRLEVDLPAGGRVKKVFALAGPSRVVVDLEAASLPKDTVDVGAGGTQQLRFGKPEAGTQRVVLVLEGDGKPDAVDARLQGDRLIATWHR